MKKQPAPPTTIIELNKEEAQDLLDAIEGKINRLAQKRATSQVTMPEFLSETTRLSNRYNEIQGWLNTAAPAPEQGFTEEERRLLSQYNFLIVDKKVAQFEGNKAVLLTKTATDAYELTYNRLSKHSDSTWGALMGFKTLIDNNTIPVVRR